MLTKTLSYTNSYFDEINMENPENSFKFILNHIFVIILIYVKADFIVCPIKHGRLGAN